MALGPQDEPLEPRRDVERLARIAKEPKLAIDYVARSASPPAGTGELLRAAVIGVPVAANDYKEQAPPQTTFIRSWLCQCNRWRRLRATLRVVSPAEPGALVSYGRKLVTA